MRYVGGVTSGRFVRVFVAFPRPPVSTGLLRARSSLRVWKEVFSGAMGGKY